ncbi:arsinothricin resistance N-acetyltransferase ArsN1 family B [Phenylobacterium sp.]|uniref:arsinothricin resistance N-acetyltransferase ArsN1 family B n=1 Tax=Phenylobacterium sp. TaxID=1871053 RepID=UPI002F40CABE
MASPSWIRIATLQDAPALAAIYAPYVAETAVSLEASPPDEAEMAARVARLGPDFPWLVCEQEGRALGYAYAAPYAERAGYRWSAAATVYVARDAHRAGIGRALYRRLLSILELQGFHAVFGGITLPNAASVGLHEACGFSQVGVYREVGYKLGAWHDVGWWGLTLGAPAHDPAPPLAFSTDLFQKASSAGPC